MPQIKLAKSAGFCFGVNRAVNIVTELAGQGRQVSTLGPIIHNEQMVEQLKRSGVRIAESPGDRSGEDEVMVIRSHGVARSVHDEVASGGEYVDATCPYVSNIHRIVEKASAAGDIVLIAGDKTHPEVIGISGRTTGECYVFEDNDELQKLINEHPEFGQNSLTAVCQTTYNALKWTKCQETLKKLCTNAKIFDTICKATALRQQEADELSKECDVMIVIGGRNSSNTAKLKEICLANCPATFLIETADELPLNTVSKADKIGVTAGASTPPAIIKEVLITMSEMENTVNTTETVVETESFEEMLEASLVASTDQKVKGTVLAVNATEIQVDIGRKHTGIVPYREYSSDPNADLTAEVHVGDVLDLIIMRTNDQEGTVTLSKRRFDAIAGWDKIVEAKESEQILEGKVTEINKGGVVVTCEGIRVFVPASQATVSRVESLDFLKGTDVKFRVIEIGRGRRAVGSIRSVLREERKANEAKFWENIEVGQVIRGTVKTLTSYGAFVDLGGVDGMVHISELSWARIKHPSEVVNVGDEIDVVVKAVDLEKHKISLGYKKESENPKTILAEQYPVGTVAKVTIVSMTDYGAFARVIDGVDGLIHISQIADHRIEKPQDVLKVGEEVDAMITEVNFDKPKPRVSLSIRALLENNEADAAEVVAEEAVEE